MHACTQPYYKFQKAMVLIYPSVFSQSAQHCIFFLPFRWLDAGKADGKIEVELVPGEKPKESSKFISASPWQTRANKIDSL